MEILTKCFEGLAAGNGCFAGLERWIGADSSQPNRVECAPAKTTEVTTDCGMPSHVTCSGCGCKAEEFGPGPRGTPLCRTCLRFEDEARLEPLTEAEKHGLHLVAKTLDVVPWTFWKPGEQPAALSDWLFLGDIHEAMDHNLLHSRGINAVLNLIGWWELQQLMPEDSPEGLAYLYAADDIAYEEVDSEDRLFFDLVGSCWPAAETFLKKCKHESRRVLVHCRAGHNRSACICVCWLVAVENMSLLAALEHVQRRRGTILSNHGFRLQLVRLALKLDRLGDDTAPLRQTEPQHQNDMDRESFNSMAICGIIKEKRLIPLYDRTASKEGNTGNPSITVHPLPALRRKDRRPSINLRVRVSGAVSQRELSMELLACLTHWDKNFLNDYTYTSYPPTIIGSGFSGDVVLCRRRNISEDEPQSRFFTNVRCVKRFNILQMKPENLEKLENEAVIYLALEHPLIAQLFDFYHDEKEVSLVMQFCSGGTLEDELRTHLWNENDFQDTAVQMLRVMNYLHGAGIVHRDIKPRNWVFELRGAGSYQTAPKLIDFGFSVKRFCPSNDEGGGSLKGCLGTLGYLAPEVVKNQMVDSAYDEKCDIWSLGVVFVELLTGKKSFHMESGTCDGYTKECILREIADISDEDVNRLLSAVPIGARRFLQRLLTRNPQQRASAEELLNDPYLRDARNKLVNAPDSLSADEVIRRFRKYGQASMPTRTSLLAMARAPTQLPHSEFCAIRGTFDMLDAPKLKGTVDFHAFMSVVSPAVSNNTCEARAIWESVCGEHECLSYRELLAVLLPPIEDAFQDASPADTLKTPRRMSNRVTLPWGGTDHLDLSLPIHSFFGVFKEYQMPIQERICTSGTPVRDVMRFMGDMEQNWVLVDYENGKYNFFDYMDFNHALMAATRCLQSSQCLADAVSRMSLMPVGDFGNCSGYSPFVTMTADASLGDILRRIVSTEENGMSGVRSVSDVRRIAILGSSGDVIAVVSSSDIWQIALRYSGPRALLKSRDARALDRRGMILEISVPHDKSILHALQVMDAEHQPVSLATSRELSGDLGGAAAFGVVSVTDLRYVFGKQWELSALDLSVREFIAWRLNRASANSVDVEDKNLAKFSVVSVESNETLHVLACRLLSSKLQRIFLSSNELARVVGIVSARDILVEVHDQLVPSCALSERVQRSLRRVLNPE